MVPAFTHLGSITVIGGTLASDHTHCVVSICEDVLKFQENNYDNGGQRLKWTCR